MNPTPVPQPDGGRDGGSRYSAFAGRDVDSLHSTNLSRLVGVADRQAAAKDAILNGFLAGRDAGRRVSPRPIHLDAAPAVSRPHDATESEPEPLGVGGKVGVIGTLITASSFGYEVGASVAPTHAPILEVLAYGAVGLASFALLAGFALYAVIRR